MAVAKQLADRDIRAMPMKGIVQRGNSLGVPAERLRPIAIIAEHVCKIAIAATQIPGLGRLGGASFGREPLTHRPHGQLEYNNLLYTG